MSICWKSAEKLFSRRRRETLPNPRKAAGDTGGREARAEPWGEGRSQQIPASLVPGIAANRRAPRGARPCIHGSKAVGRAVPLSRPGKPRLRDVKGSLTARTRPELPKLLSQL